MRIITRERQQKFDSAAEAILNKEYGDEFNTLRVTMFTNLTSSSPEKLHEYYMRAITVAAKVELAAMINLFFRGKGEQERAFFFALDSLYLQNIGNDSIRTILKKYPLLANMVMSTSECDDVISALLSYLENNSATRWDNFEDLSSEKYSREFNNRNAATRVLVMLNKYPVTSQEARELILEKKDLIVFYFQEDRSVFYFAPETLDSFLSGYRLC